jgi:hypothetical protein
MPIILAQPVVDYQVTSMENAWSGNWAEARYRSPVILAAVSILP